MSKCPQHLNLPLQAAGMWLYQLTSCFNLTLGSLPSLELMSLPRSVPIPENSPDPPGLSPTLPAGAAAPRLIALTHVPSLAGARAAPVQVWLAHHTSHIILTLVKKREQCGPKISWQKGSKAEQFLGSPSIIFLALWFCSRCKQQPVKLGFLLFCFFFVVVLAFLFMYLFIPSQHMFIYSL